jgi:hypothetical protein
MGIAFKTFKGKLYKKFILEGKEPSWDGGEYTKQKDLWQKFKQYRESEEYLELSRKNKENSLKASNPHHLGSHGYARNSLALSLRLPNGSSYRYISVWRGGYTTAQREALAPQVQP